MPVRHRTSMGEWMVGRIVYRRLFCSDLSSQVLPTSALIGMKDRQEEDELRRRHGKRKEEHRDKRNRRIL